MVSWDAQYLLIRSVKHSMVIAALEAGIPDVGALIFATLGIALALHGRRALRPRTLNVACVGISLAMNAIASAPGWRDLAIWVMPSAVYALASDTLIGVVRAWVIARARHTGQALADDEPTPMAVLGGAVAVAAAPVARPANPPSAGSAAGSSRNAPSPPAVQPPARHRDPVRCPARHPAGQPGRLPAVAAHRQAEASRPG